MERSICKINKTKKNREFTADQGNCNGEHKVKYMWNGCMPIQKSNELLLVNEPPKNNMLAGF
jgi:hypothetical protein